MDTELAVYTELYNVLSADTELKALTGQDPAPVNILMAPPDSPFPYINHKLELSLEDDGVIIPATYRVDVWDYSPTAERIFQLRERVITILDRLIIDSAGGDIGKVRLFLGRCGLVGTDADQVWRYALTFGCRFDRKSQIDRILNR